MSDPVTKEQVDAAWAEARAAVPDDDAINAWEEYDELCKEARQLEIWWLAQEQIDRETAAFPDVIRLLQEARRLVTQDRCGWPH